MNNIKPRKINWPNALFFTLVPPISIVASIILWKQNLITWPTLILGLILFSFMELSITAGYHRLFSHRTYQANFLVKLFFLIFGAGALQGSALQWSLDHREHHNYVDDNDKDPYSINKGFFWAHMGWLYFKQDEQLSVGAIKAGDLINDKLVMLQYRTWVPLGLFVSFLFPALVALAWGDFWGGLFIAGGLRSVINHHSTFLINSLSHCVGKQTYSDSHSARDNWFTAFLTFGEGYHNYHHEFPSDYRNGVRVWDWDPTKWLIKGLSLVGMTSNLKKISEEIIVRKRTQMKEKRMHKKLAKLNFNLLNSNHSTMLEELKLKYENAFKQLRELRERQQELAQMRKVQRQVFIKQEIKVIKRKISEARDDFYKAIREWNLTRRRVLAYARA